MIKLDYLKDTARNKFDLTDAEYQKSLYKLSDELLNINDLGKAELMGMAGDSGIPLEFRMAIHLMRSKQYLNSLDKKLKIGVVFAMWGEQHRLYPSSTTNPNGEDTIRTKIEQLNWAVENSEVDWHLYAVDDGCPYESGKIAEEILSTHQDKDKVSVLYLADAIPTQTGSLRNLNSVDDSKKGGAIITGCQQAIEDGMDAIIYTDADNSVHLGQIGILLKPYLEEKLNVVLGNRKDPSAVLVKQENRWGIGIKLLRHMQRMVGVSIFSRGILDSQAAFKLYDSKLLDKIIKDPAVFDFSFDSDWIAASIMRNEDFAKVPFSFVDSFAESASIVQGPMSTWETLLLGLVRSVRHRGLSHNKKMAQVLEEEIRSPADLDLLINSLPPQLFNIEDKDLGDPDVMSPEEVKEWIIEMRSERVIGVKE